MQFTTIKPATDKVLGAKLASSGWKKVKEPKNLVAATLLSLPIAVLLGFVTIGITYWLNPELYAFIDADGFNIRISFKGTHLIITIAFIFVFMLIHELIHVLLIPNFLKSDKTYIGINGLIGFVYTTEKIRKGRFVLISILPYLILSVILPLLFYCINLLNGYLVFLCLINAIGSSVDMLNILIILQVPNGAVLINNGFETYYKDEFCLGENEKIDIEKFRAEVLNTRWDSFKWTYYNPQKVAPALTALALATQETKEGIAQVAGSTADLVLNAPTKNAVLSAIGNNHSGTYYPVAKEALPFIIQVALKGNHIVSRNCAINVLIELYYFTPEFGQDALEEYVKDTIRAVVDENREHFLNVALMDSRNQLLIESLIGIAGEQD